MIKHETLFHDNQITSRCLKFDMSFMDVYVNEA